MRIKGRDFENDDQFFSKMIEPNEHSQKLQNTNLMRRQEEAEILNLGKLH